MSKNAAFVAEEMKQAEVLMKYKENQVKDCLGLLESKVFQGNRILLLVVGTLLLPLISRRKDTRTPGDTVGLLHLASPPLLPSGPLEVD